MQSLSLPSELQDKVRTWFNYNWEHQKTLSKWISGHIEQLHSLLFEVESEWLGAQILLVSSESSMVSIDGDMPDGRSSVHASVCFHHIPPTWVQHRNNLLFIMEERQPSPPFSSFSFHNSSLKGSSQQSIKPQAHVRSTSVVSSRWCWSSNISLPLWPALLHLLSYLSSWLSPLSSRTTFYSSAIFWYQLASASKFPSCMGAFHTRVLTGLFLRSSPGVDSITFHLLKATFTSAIWVLLSFSIVPSLLSTFPKCLELLDLFQIFSTNFNP